MTFDSGNRRYPRIEGESEEEAAASLAAEFEDEDEFEDESEYEDEAFLGGIAKALGGLLGESEDEEEGEYEFEFEAEAEPRPKRKVSSRMRRSSTRFVASTLTPS